MGDVTIGCAMKVILMGDGFSLVALVLRKLLKVNGIVEVTEFKTSFLV